MQKFIVKNTLLFTLLCSVLIISFSPQAAFALKKTSFASVEIVERQDLALLAKADKNLDRILIDKNLGIATNSNNKFETNYALDNNSGNNVQISATKIGSSNLIEVAALKTKTSNNNNKSTINLETTVSVKDTKAQATPSFIAIELAALYE